MKFSLFRSLPLSREGLLWFIISSAMLVTGLLKGINLITLLACWMTILVLLNYCWAYPQLRHLLAILFAQVGEASAAAHRSCSACAGDCS